jgi:transcriptional regulator with XRE-family HTH domain
VRSVTEVSVDDRRALNQALLHSAKVPARAVREPATFVRALRSALRMSQSQLARRAGVPKAHLARLERGRVDPRLSTLRRLLDAMFCDVLILPLARVKPGEAVALRRLEPREGYWWRLWDEKPLSGTTLRPP